MGRTCFCNGNKRRVTYGDRQELKQNKPLGLRQSPIHTISRVNKRGTLIKSGLCLHCPMYAGFSMSLLGNGVC